MTFTPETTRLLAALDEASVADARNGLQQLRDIYFDWLVASTVAVAVGIFLEIGEIKDEIHHEFVRWKRGYVPVTFSPETGMPKVDGVNWNKLWAAVGWLLIAIGVGFEGWLEYKVSEQDVKIQNIDLAHVATLDSEVIEARTESRAAQGQAASASEAARVASLGALNAFRDAERANKHAAQLDAENIEQREKSVELAIQLGKEQQTRLELEKSLADRKIPLIIKNGGRETNFQSLKPFGGLKALIEFIPDAEPRRLAMQIAIVLRQAGWNIEGLSPLTHDVSDGVLVLSYAVHSEDIANPAAVMEEMSGKSAKAAQALSDFLKGCNVQANWGSAFHGDVPDMNVRDPNSLKVFVGLKPSPYFDPEWLKKTRQQVDEALAIAKLFRPTPPHPLDLPCSGDPTK